MGTGTISVIKRKTVSITITANTKTGSQLTGVDVDQIVSIILMKNDDVYYNPIIYSLRADNQIEAMVVGNAPSTARTYSFYVFYR